MNQEEHFGFSRGVNAIALTDASVPWALVVLSLSTDAQGIHVELFWL
jgi:hypothetical protein